MSTTARNLGAALVLLILGAIAYGTYNPAFAASCKATYAKSAAWVNQRTSPTLNAFKNSKFYSSYVRALVEHRSRSQARKEKAKKAATESAASKAPPLDMSPEAIRKREQVNWSVGQKIAYGPAFAQHGKELGFKNEDQMASHIDRVIGYAGPSTTKVIAGGRTVYWDDRTHSVVIVEPNESGGTMYRPNEGYPFFKDLKAVQ